MDSHLSTAQNVLRYWSQVTSDTMLRQVDQNQLRLRPQSWPQKTEDRPQHVVYQVRKFALI